MLEILNLGGGRQSTTLALMSVAGELPKLKCAIFADTGWEPAAVYTHLDWLTEYCKPFFPIHRVAKGNIRDDLLAQGAKRYMSMPQFVLNNDGTTGMVRRQCTGDYKIDPIERFIKQEILGLTPKRRLPTSPLMRQWFGISWDEWQRMKTTDAKWKVHYYPLCERRITVHGCIEWLKSRGFTVPPKSACIGCPYHGDSTWRTMKAESPSDFEEACQVDEAMRHKAGMNGQLFIHRSCKPLREVDFRNDFDKGQLPLFSDGAGCDSGHCFV